MPAPISVLILTLNEEANLPRCLEAVAWSDDIVVFDSFSTDRTVEIAKAFGARVIQRKFDNWSSHQNWAVRNIPFKHKWVYYSDADEVVSSALAQEMGEVVADSSRPEVAYRLRFKNMLMGRWLKHASLYPTWVMRLFIPERVRWERLVNPVPVVDGAVGELKEHFEHYTFRKGLTDWFAKHNRYSLGEAYELLKHPPVHWGDLFSRNPMRRRTSLKNLAYMLPGRPILIFFYLYLIRCGFLDGRPGLTYCALRAVYEFLISLKALELRRRERAAAQAIPPALSPSTMPADQRPDCSVLILTLNEECNIPQCVSSVSWCDDVVVFDSGSTDRTAELSEKLGARVFYHKFDNYAAQRNAALTEVPYKHPWVLMLDADECTEDALVPELAGTIRNSPPTTALFRLRRKDYFLDRWIKSSSGYPTWFARVMKVGFVQFQREVHEDAVAQGQVGMLRGFLTHQPFSKGIGDWFDRHNRYSLMEANLRMTKQERPPFGAIFSGDASQRRRLFKAVAYCLPLRPYLVFLYLYVGRLGLLEGKPGMIYCILRGIYEFMIDVKTRELRRQKKGLET